MAYWHYADGTPAPPFKGRFDPSHLWPLLPIAVFGLYYLTRWIFGL
jgi:hypothetical protein